MRLTGSVTEFAVWRAGPCLRARGRRRRRVGRDCIGHARSALDNPSEGDTGIAEARFFAAAVETSRWFADFSFKGAMSATAKVSQAMPPSAIRS